jgi:hypothetical protein
MRVELSAHRMVFPATCACCGRCADSRLEVCATNSNAKRLHRKVWEVPYCSSCVEHVRSAEQADARDSGAASCLVLVLAVAIGAAVAWWLGVLVGLGGLLAVGHSIQRMKEDLLGKAERFRGPSCACLKRTVQYLEWRGTCHSFEVIAEKYALELMVANLDKLVNLTPEAIDLLSRHGHAPPTGAPQSARRYDT